MTHMYVIFGPGHGLSPARHQAFIFNNPGGMSIWFGLDEINVGENWIKTQNISFKKMYMKTLCKTAPI